MTAEKEEPGWGLDQPGGGGTAAGDDSRDQAHSSTTPRGVQALNLGALDLAEEARKSIESVKAAAGSNGKGPHDPAPAPRFKVLSAGELKGLPPIAWLVKGEIPKLGLTLIYGPTGTGKSFVTLDYAIQIAQGRPVVYVAAEGAAGYAARVLAWEKHHAGQSLGQLFFVGQAVNLLDPNAVDDFLQAIAPLSPALVIVDTLARCMVGGDENSAQDMGQAVDSADMIMRALNDGRGGAVILVHHSTKAGNTERGSGALKAACEQVIRLDAEDGLLTVTCEKSKDSTPFDPRYLRLLPVVTGRRNDDAEEESSCVVIAADKVIMVGMVTGNGRKLLEALALEAFCDTGGRQSALIKASGVPEGSFARTVSSLMRDGFASQDAKGEPYRITEAGRKKLSELS